MLDIMMEAIRFGLHHCIIQKARDFICFANIRVINLVVHIIQFSVAWFLIQKQI